MLKAATDHHVVLGITPAELEILKQGQPIVVRLHDVGYEKAVITLFVGESNEDMKKQLEAVNRRIELMKSVPKLDLSKLDLSKLDLKKGH